MEFKGILSTVDNIPFHLHSKIKRQLLKAAFRSCCFALYKKFLLRPSDYFLPQPFLFFWGTSPTTDRAPTTFWLWPTTDRDPCSGNLKILCESKTQTGFDILRRSKTAAVLVTMIIHDRMSLTASACIRSGGDYLTPLPPSRPPVVEPGVTPRRNSAAVGRGGRS